MADKSTLSPRPSSEDSPDREPPGSHGRLARKWSRLSSNLLASGLVLIAAIALLRYVAPWWKEEGPPSPKAQVTQAVGPGIDADDPNGVLSGFGDLSHSLRQSHVVGGSDEARAQLRQLCRLAVSSISVPERKIGAAERRVLARLAAETPIAIEPGRWRMYEQDGPAPIVAVVPWPAGQDEADFAGVLSWGIAIPAADANWTLFVYPGRGNSESPVVGLPTLELPPGTVRTMSLSSENGGGMLAFGGEADLVFCQHHFDGWAAAADLPQATPWRMIGRQWLARYGNEKVGWMAVHLFEDRGRLNGGFVAFSRGTAPSQIK